MRKEIKEADLREDEFNPRVYFNSKFVKMPRSILQYEHISMGAKMLYGVLVGLGSSGTAWPTKEYLKKAMGGPSLRTLYRWQVELERHGLIKVKFKGRGLSNNYYFLCSPIIGNGGPAIDPVLANYPMSEAVKEAVREYQMHTGSLMTASEINAEIESEIREIREKKQKELQELNGQKMREINKEFALALNEWRENGKVGQPPTPPPWLSWPPETNKI